MTVQAIIAELEALPEADRSKVFAHFQDLELSIPESFKRGMHDAAAGRHVEMEQALGDAPPPR
jgi:predicted transcriptional regulator